MKRKLIILSLAGIMLTANSCKKNDASNLKIDFTQSYEDAALALATAQKNYDEAVATNDPVKIESAKMELQAAQEKYLVSKKVYVAEGGTVKSKYESYLATSTQTLETKKPDIVSDVIKKSDSIVNVKTNAKIENKVTEAKAKVTEVKAKVITEKAKIVEDINKKVSDIKNIEGKAKEDINKSTEEIKKAADEKLNKAKQDLNDFLKQN